jgi:hypothetical protein
MDIRKFQFKPVIRFCPSKIFYHYYPSQGEIYNYVSETVWRSLGSSNTQSAVTASSALFLHYSLCCEDIAPNAAKEMRQNGGTLNSHVNICLERTVPK